MITRDQVRTCLLASSLKEASAFVEALDGGWGLEQAEGEVSCSDLEEIYERRFRHLSKMEAPHPKRLAGNISEFLEGLRGHQESRAVIVNLEGNAGVSFIVVLLVGSLEAIGCLHVVSKLKVSSDEWEKLWST